MQYHLGMIQYFLGQIESARRSFQRALAAQDPSAIKEDATQRLLTTNMNLANDSDATLVNAPLDEQPLVLVLSRDDVRNAEMRRRDGRGGVLYRTESDKSSSRISLYGPSSTTPIALFETKGLFGFDKISFGGEKRRKVKDWISGYGSFQTL